MLNVIVLNWNGFQDTKTCLESILSCQENRDISNLLVVDNNSNEDEFHSLCQWAKDLFDRTEVIYDVDKVVKREFDDFSRLTIVRNNDNLGFANGNNQGLRYLNNMVDSLNYCLLLNNDTIVEKGALKKLYEFMEANPSYVAATPQIRLEEPVDHIWNCGGDLTFFGTRKYNFNNQPIGVIPSTNHIDISYITGCALLFRFQEMRFLSSKFFFGEEDYEFSLRAKEKRLNMACVLDSIITHKVGGTVKKKGPLKFGASFLYYVARLINLRDFYSKPRYLITKILILIYLLYSINKRYNFGFVKTLKIVNRIRIESKSKNSVDKKYFLENINAYS